MLNRPSKQKIIINSWAMSLLAALALYLGLIAAQASGRGGKIVDITVAFGPLKLMVLHKVAVAGGGYRASIKLLPGLISYFLFFAIFGLLVGAIRIRARKPAETGREE